MAIGGRVWRTCGVVRHSGGARRAPRASVATLHELIDGLAAFGERPALIAFTAQGRQEWSYAELAGTVRQLAEGLVATGLEPGDRVALFAPDRPEWIAAALAAVRAGAVVTPLDAQFTDEPLAHALADSGASVVFTAGDRVIDWTDWAACGRMPVSSAWMPRRVTPGAGDAGWGRSPARCPTASPAMGRPLFYTSGTTGPPKGVPLTHGNLAFQVHAVLAVGLVAPADRVCLPLPLHHVYPFVLGVLTPLALGLPLVLPEALTGPQILRALKEGEATLLVGVPRLYGALLAGIEARVASRGRAPAAVLRLALGLSTWARRRLGRYWGKRLLGALHAQLAPSLRLLACGGAALDPAIARKLESLGWQLATGYGLTETAPSSR